VLLQGARDGCVGIASEHGLSEVRTQGCVGAESNGKPQRVAERQVLRESRFKGTLSWKGGGGVAGGFQQHPANSQDKAF
jgi:hypothetical protein